MTTGRSRSPADAYAAADVVVFPSTWEGFGNPVIESIVARRPLVVSSYPVLDEITPDRIAVLRRRRPVVGRDVAARPDLTILEDNRRIARAHYDLADLPDRLGGVLDARLDHVVTEPGSRSAPRRARPASPGVGRAGAALGYLGAPRVDRRLRDGVATDFPSLWVNLSIGCLVAACLILPVPIVLGYGIRAAEREDRERR